MSDIGSARHRAELVVLDEAGGEREHAQALLAHPLVGRVDARRAPRRSGPASRSSARPTMVQRASTTSGPPLTSWIDALAARRRVTRWKVAMNL